MAGNSVIGALRVDLGLNSASFEAGLKNAQKGLSNWQAAALGGFAAVAAAGVAAGVALSRAMGSAIGRFDEMSKAAQKVGVSVEALSRLEYAAKMSDVSLEQLTGGLQRLAQGMADIASGSSGPAAKAFEALGISVTNANGQLRASDEVFAEVAERFGRIEDGSTKTALAIAIFGKAGADLIPLLNEGKAGLSALADEADRYGQTIGGEAAANAEAFNDNLSRVQMAMQGVTNVLTAATLPVLKYLSQAFVDAAGNGKALSAFSRDFVTVLKATISVAAIAVTAIKALGEAVATLMAAVSVAQTGFQNWGVAGKIIENGMTNLQAEVGATTEFVNGLWAAMENAPKAGWGAKLPDFGTGNGSPIDVPTFSDAGAAAQSASRLEALRQSLMTEQQLEMDSHAKRLEEIQKFYESGAILRGEYDTLLLAAQQQHADKMTEITQKQVEKEAKIREQLVGNVASIFGSLSTLAESFGEKGLVAAKAFAVAEAVVNTAQGITKALAQGGILGFAGAAAVAAAGAAQIATILSASKGSSSKPSAGSAPSSTSSAATSEASSSQGLHLTLQGDVFSRAGIEGTLAEIQDWLGVQGKQLVIDYK